MPNLPERSFRVLREVARTLFDAGAGVPEARLDWLIAELRELFERAGALTRVALRASIAFLQLAPLFALGRLARFTGLAPEERVRVLERVEGGPFNMLFVAVKLYLCMVYFEHPEASRATGYDGRALVPPPAAAAAAEVRS